MVKKLIAYFKRPLKQKGKQHKNFVTRQTGKKAIEVVVIINRTQVRALVDSTLDYSLIDPQLRRSLGIKAKEKEQPMIARDIHQ